MLDTSGLLAVIDDSELDHGDCVRALEAAEPPFVLSPFVLAELDYLVKQRVGEAAPLALLEDVAAEAYTLVAFTSGDVAAARAVIEQFADLRVSLADASIVALSERYGVRDLLTLDDRHFRVLRGARGLPFRVLPADA